MRRCLLALIVLSVLLALSDSAAAQCCGAAYAAPRSTAAHYVPGPRGAAGPYRCYYYYYYYYRGTDPAEARRNFEQISRHFVTTEHGYQGYRYFGPAR